MSQGNDCLPAPLSRERPCKPLRNGGFWLGYSLRLAAFSQTHLHFRKCREFLPETGSPLTGSSASYYVLDIAYIIVFLGSLFCREFAGFTGLVSKAIRGRDGFTRVFGCGRYENLSGAISWLTFFAGGAADVRRSRSDWRRELAESLPTRPASPVGDQSKRPPLI